MAGADQYNDNQLHTAGVQSTLNAEKSLSNTLQKI